MKRFATVLLAAGLAGVAPAGAAPRVLGYRLAKKRAPSEAALAAVTHIVDRTGSAEPARAPGKGVLLGLDLSVDPESAARVVAQKGCDGADLDLTRASSARTAEAASLVAELRRRLPSPKLVTVAVAPGYGSLAAAVAPHVDQITILSDAPLGALQKEVERLVNAGVPREKLALSIWLEGYAALAERLDIREYDYSDKEYRWDASAQAAYRGARRYENEASIRRKAEFARREGLGGLAAWDLSGALRPTQPERRRELLVGELANAIAGKPSVPPPAPAPGDVLFADPLEPKPDADAWIVNENGALTRRAFAGAAVTLSVSGAAKTDVCAVGLRAGARGRYCVAFAGGSAVLRKLVDGRSFDLSMRRPLKGASARRRVSAQARDLSGGRVALTATVDGVTLTGEDDGSVGGPALTAGAVALPAETSGLSADSLEVVMLSTAAAASAGDAVAPVLAGVEARIAGGAASVVWTTNEPADARVEYGETDAYGKTAEAAGGLSREHSVGLPDLALGKTYHYRVVSRDAAGNVAASADHTITLSGGGRYAPASEPAPEPAQTPEGVVMLRETFERPDGLITNEWATYNSGSPSAVKSSVWLVTSGSLFAQGNAAWTGAPDGSGPDAGSTNATGSAVFRVVTQRQDFADVAVQFNLLNQGLTSTARTPAVAWDGVHVFLRYRSEEQLYYASINRRDNKIVVKKKVPGGSSNGGTYYNISPVVSYAVPYNQWTRVMATARDNADGSVTIALYAEGQLLLQAVDDGSIGGAPIRGAGRTGIRGDNANIKFDDFTATALAPEIIGGGGGGGSGGSGGVVGGGTGTGGSGVANLALNKDLLASSHAGLGLEPERANDADPVSKWTSLPSDSQWLMADLGVAHDVSGATIRWDANHATAYEIQTSPDGSAWTTVYQKAGGVGGDETAVFTAAPARFVRVAMAARARSEGYGVRELEVHGSAPAGADVQPPQISDIETTGVASAGGTLTVSWMTDEPADSRVDYGATALYGTRAQSTELVSKHVVEIAGLTPGKVYHYRLRSRDAFGNVGGSADRVVSIGGAAGSSDSDDAARAQAKFLSPAKVDGYNDKAIFGPAAMEVTIMDVRGKRVFKGRRSGSAIVWDCRDGGGRLVESGVYIARIKKSDNGVIFQSLAVVK